MIYLTVLYMHYALCVYVYVYIQVARAVAEGVLGRLTLDRCRIRAKNRGRLTRGVSPPAHVAWPGCDNPDVDVALPSCFETTLGRLAPRTCWIAVTL